MYRQQQKKKSDTPYCGTPHHITKIEGNRVTAVREGHTIVRHTTFFKKIKTHPADVATTTDTSQTESPTTDAPQPEVPFRTNHKATTEAIPTEEDDNESFSDTVPYADSTNSLDEEEEDKDVKPTRQRCIPTRFKDYDTKLPQSLMEEGSNVV